ncbi:P-loop NTPase fold protein [Burkholderia gladioli]|uniref:P-loop NTPase fold protein n=1 Tax=Burkholderia gladioli TaxID=28095 RepID=UPI0016405661|nr:P-loop NTPase fold protein [Burkholderia gladioli]
MTKAIIEQVITGFIGDTVPGVLAITGPWGVGKTFLLRNIIAGFSSSGGLRKYAYASAFGVQSIAEIRTTLLAKTRRLPFEGEATGGIRSRIEAQVEKRNLRVALNALREMIPWGGKHMVVALEAIAGSMIRDTVIVLDDLERSGAKLTVQELMGLASDLKEQGRCKVILVFNEDQLDADASHAYETLAEKVVDQKLEFALDVPEAIDIGLANDTPMRELLVAPLTALQVSNIRVIKKVETAARMLDRVVGGRSLRVRQQAATTIAVLACSLYERGRGFPPPDELVRYNYFTHRMGRVDAGQSAEVPEWIGRLEACQYSSTDDFDRALLEAMTQGYVAGTDIDAQAQALDAIVNREQLEKIFSDAWDLFHERFDVDAATVADALTDAVRQSAMVISPLNLNATTRLLRELGFGERADAVLEMYIAARRSTPEIFDVDEAARMGNIDDPQTRARFVEVFKAARPVLSLEAAADLIIQNTNWSDDIPEAFNRANSDQLIALFLSHQGPNLKLLVTGIFRMPGSPEERESVRLKIVQALQVVGQRSLIDRMRVQRLGVQMN